MDGRLVVKYAMRSFAYAQQEAKATRTAKRRRRLNEPIANGLGKVPMNGLRSVTNGDNKRWHLGFRKLSLKS